MHDRTPPESSHYEGRIRSTKTWQSVHFLPRSREFLSIFNLLQLRMIAQDPEETKVVLWGNGHEGHQRQTSRLQRFEGDSMMSWFSHASVFIWTIPILV
ncbi:predicted protein [Botrytis cinerea T4]|uniref:Uncharacterized protein n=1 Tax=Botryotinia fuckeliana (strain T4) TaxID=999810 RepID=G2YT99_BOTF4|nr:predicted protein [Botrytis cinerea T4]